MDPLTVLVASPDLPTGASALLPTSCTPATGPANVDGRCIMGGTVVASGRRGHEALGAATRSPEVCSAFPVYLRNNVPYTRGQVAGNHYSALANIYTYTRLNTDWARHNSAAQASGQSN